MKKIKVHFHLNTMMYGGLEKVMFTYLRNIDKNKYDLSLSIGRCMYDLEQLKNELPTDISLSYLIKSRIINFTQYKKNKKLKLSKLERLIHNILLRPLSEWLYRKRIFHITKGKDVVVDFDFYSELVYTQSPIVSFLHFSLISQLNWDINKDSRVYKRIKNKFATHDRVVLLNHDTLNECINIFPEHQRKYHVIYNPFNLNLIRELSLKEFNNVYGDYIVSVCRLDESQKDVTTLIKAFDLIVNKYNYNGNLVLVGDGPSRANLEKLVLSLGLTHRVFFVGIQSNPFQFMKHAKLFVLSSKFEGLPSVVIEALIVGIPIIAADCPTGAKEILNDGEYGDLFDVGDYEKLAILTNKLLTSESRRLEFISKSSIRANDFGIQNALNKFDILINDLLKRPE